MASRAPQGDVRPGAAGVFDERSTSEVIASLVTNTQGLVRTEIELAKLEVQKIVKEKAIGIGLALGGALFLLYVLAFSGITAANAFMLIVPDWLAWLIVTGIYLLIAAIMLFVALRLFKRPSKPETTQAELERTRDWAKDQVNS